jgi:serine/threonine-protein kinase
MKICLRCEGVTDSDRQRCSTCGIRLVHRDEVVFARRAGEEESMNPWLGAVIDGKYRILSVLGVGGMGTVFRAVHEVSHAPVALKLLHPRLASQPEYREVFIAEARKASLIRNERVARVQDVGQTAEGVVYIAMELVDGSTMHDLLANGGALGWRRTALLGRQVAEGLHAAHQSGVIHQDLSPKNIMVETRDGRETIKILDLASREPSAPMRPAAKA